MSWKGIKQIDWLGSLLAAGLVALPFVFWQGARVAYEVPRVWFVWGWVGVAGCVSLVGTFCGRKINQIRWRKLLPLGLWLGWALISSIVGIDPVKSWRGNYYRLDGLPTLLVLAGLSVLVNIYFKENWKKYISGGIVGGVVLVSLWAVSRGVRLHWLGDSGVENWYGSIGVSFGQPNFLAGYLLVTLPFWNLVNNRHKDRKIKILILSGVLVQIGAILLTDSIAGMVGVGVWLLWSWLSKYRRYGLILISLVLVIAGVFGLAWSTTANEIPEGRQRIMYRAFSAVLSRPVTGWGIANVDKAIDSVVWPMKFKNDVYVDKAHSHLLEMLVTTGFVGLGLYILMVSVWLKRLMVSLKNKPEDHAWRETLLLVVCLYIFHTQTNVISIAEEVVFWVMMGLI